MARRRMPGALRPQRALTEHRPFSASSAALARRQVFRSGGLTPLHCRPVKRIVAMADTHGRHRKLTVPEGDLLIHAGDLTGRGTLPQVEDAIGWLRSLPHKNKVV